MKMVVCDSCDDSIPKLLINKRGQYQICNYCKSLEEEVKEQTKEFERRLKK